MSLALRRWLVIIAWLVPIAIFLQALLAGQGLFVDPTLFGLHGILSNLTLLVSVVAAVLAWAARTSRTTALLASLTVLGVIAQTGLGYAGRRSGLVEASAAHVSLGVALFGLAVAVALLVNRDRSTSR